MTSDRHDNQYSSDFPSGYGDFELKSSDNVIFSFPCGLLAHVSPIFKDMFALGDPNQKEPLPLTENAEAIRQFLLYIDPLKESPKLTTGSMTAFVEVAKKYQVPMMLEAFKKWTIAVCIGPAPNGLRQQSNIFDPISRQPGRSSRRCKQF
jgi:hypothetical protein